MYAADDDRKGKKKNQSYAFMANKCFRKIKSRKKNVRYEVIEINVGKFEEGNV